MTNMMYSYLSGSKSYSIYVTNNSTFTNMDYNYYCSTGPNGVLAMHQDTDIATMAAFQTATGDNQHSICCTPTISYTPLDHTTSTSARTLTATIQSDAGVPTSGTGLPVLYWQINDGYLSAATGSYLGNDKYSFTFGSGTAAGNRISYYIVAQDLSSPPRISCYGPVMHTSPTPQSTMLGAGIPVSAVTDDYAGVPRSVTAPTIGAYENAGNVSYYTNPPGVSEPPIDPDIYLILPSSTTSCEEDLYCGEMDVVFLVDNTGSMYRAIENVKSELDGILDCIEKVSGNNYRLALATFKDDIYIHHNFALRNRAAISSSILSLIASDGAKMPEASDEALRTVIHARTKNEADWVPPIGNHQNMDFTPDWRTYAHKLIIIVTDAPPGGFDDLYSPGYDDVNAHLRAVEAKAKGIRISAVYIPIPNVSNAAPTVLMDYAATSGGTYYPAQSDGSGTGLTILNVLSTCGQNELSVGLDIKAGSCPNPLNTSSNGVLPVTILGSSTFDVSTIDLSTVKLDGVSPTSWYQYDDVGTPYSGDLTGCYSCNTGGSDGYQDLKLKFPIQPLVAMMPLLIDGECRVVHLTGNLNSQHNNMPFRAKDILKVIVK